MTGELHKATQTIPIVFNLTADPVGLGYIESMSRPGGNLTGFIFFEPPLIGKWFELLKQVSPGVAQTSLLFNPGTAGFYLKFFEGQPGLGTLIKLASVRDMAEFETTLAGLAATQGASVIIPADPFISSNGTAIVKLVERFKLPAVYTYRQLAVDGGLMACGPDTFALRPFTRPPTISTVYCAGKNRRICPRRRQPNISSCSTFRPRGG